MTWVYGVNNFLDNIEEMGMKLPTVVKWIWRVLLVVVTPVVLLTVTILSWIGRDPLSYAGYVYPSSVQGETIQFCRKLIFEMVKSFSVTKC